jgi:hypothetical protein
MRWLKVEVAKDAQLPRQSEVQAEDVFVVVVVVVVVENLLINELNGHSTYRTNSGGPRIHQR